MGNAWLSVLPATIMIAAAILSRRILPALALGLLVGGYLLHPSILGGLETVIEHVITTLSDGDSLKVLLFLYLFSGLILLVRRAGGITAFSGWLARYVRSDTGVLYALWALIPATFIDCAFRIVGAGSIMRPLAEKHGVAKERLAFMLNNTASPVIELVPIATTFVGFNIANIGLGLKAAGVQQDHSPYRVLLQAIPFEFFSIAVLLITFASIRFPWGKPPAGTRSAPVGKAHGGMSMAMEDEEPEIKPRMVNLVLPMLSVVILSIFFFWFFGREEGGGGSIASAIAATDPNKAMLVALVLSMVLTGGAYRLQGYSVKKMTDDVIAGGNDLMTILVILVIAWSLGSVSRDLGLSSFVQQGVGSALPGWSVPLCLFALSSVVTYFIGEGWAAASLIMPFAISIAVSAGAGIPICVAAVITGGTFGDVTSPVAGMTNMASGVAGADQMKYMRYASRYNFAALALAAALFLVFGVLG